MVYPMGLDALDFRHKTKQGRKSAEVSIEGEEGAVLFDVRGGEPCERRQGVDGRVP